MVVCRGLRRGFILAGAYSYASTKPLVPVRKYKEFYRRFDGCRASFTNWKGEEEALYLFDHSHYRGRRALFVDDVLETCNSLRSNTAPVC